MRTPSLLASAVTRRRSLGEARRRRSRSLLTVAVGAKKVAKRSKCKPFIKAVNYNHLMPTRYALELEGLKGIVSNETFKEESARQDAKKQVKAIFEERFQAGKSRWFFAPLRVRRCFVGAPLTAAVLSDSPIDTSRLGRRLRSPAPSRIVLSRRQSAL